MKDGVRLVNMRMLACVLCTVFVLGSTAPAFAGTRHQWEAQVGQQEYQTLQKQGVILSQSPYYKILNPIAARIANIADKQYSFPFHFYLVHMSQPNAFAVPGGNVYVTDSMMSFAQNKEELAGVLCHETSHDIHHDVYNLAAKRQQIGIVASIADMLLGGGRSSIVNSILGVGANLESLKFSRTVEQNADHKGAFTCAQAGINPWGMVWLLQRFKSANMPSPPEFLSDHPGNVERIARLETLFHNTPSVFGRFNPNIASATPLMVAGFRNQQPVARPTAGSVVCPPNWKFCPPH
ncbi:MAG: M48 family metallopeptidase [Vulcanimicrobiaceae bacterium]